MVDLLLSPVEPIVQDEGVQEVDQFWIRTGGDANNNAIALARLGCEVELVARAGCDILGTYAVNLARREGVGVEHLVYSSAKEQTKSLILQDGQKRRVFYQYRGCSEDFCLEDIPQFLLKEADCLQIGGTFHLPKFDGEGARQLLKRAKETNTITCMDVTNDPTQRWNRVIACCYPHLDYFMPSIAQAKRISGLEEPEDIADFFLTQGVGTVVLKLGQKGVFCKTKQAQEEAAFYCSSYNVPYVDLTGAGDAFVAGFLSTLEEERTLEERVQFATAVSAHAIQAVGATQGIVSREEIRAFMAQQHPLEIIRI